MTIPMLIRFASLEEKKKIEKLAAKANMTIANYVRSRLDLEPLAHGGVRKKEREEASSISNGVAIPRTWVSLKVVEDATGVSIKALYQQIRKGTFPFRYRRAGRSILVSALDLGLIDSNGSHKPDD